jgi:hypothetical protein
MTNKITKIDVTFTPGNLEIWKQGRIVLHFPGKTNILIGSEIDRITFGYLRGHVFLDGANTIRIDKEKYTFFNQPILKADSKAGKPNGTSEAYILNMDTLKFFRVIKEIFCNPQLRDKTFTFDLDRFAYEPAPWPVYSWSYIWNAIIKSTGNKENVKSLKLAAGMVKRGEMSKEALTELKKALSMKIKQGAKISSNNNSGDPDFYYSGDYNGSIIYYRHSGSYFVHTWLIGLAASPGPGQA